MTLSSLITALRTARPDSLTELREQLAVVAEALHEHVGAGCACEVCDLRRTIIGDRKAMFDRGVELSEAWKERDAAREQLAKVTAERDALREELTAQKNRLEWEALDARRDRDVAREQLAKMTAERDEARRQADTVVHNLRMTETLVRVRNGCGFRVGNTVMMDGGRAVTLRLDSDFSDEEHMSPMEARTLARHLLRAALTVERKRRLDRDKQKRRRDALLREPKGRRK